VTKSCFAIAKTVKQACGSRIFFAVQWVRQETSQVSDSL
jgi:hypothetical protein